jgi:plastocyanin
VRWSADRLESFQSDANAEVRLDNLGCRFQPHAVGIRTGQTLVVGNKDTVGHNTNVASAKNGMFNPMVPAGSDLKKKFTKAERNPVPVSCNIHPWMKGYVLVQSNPYMAVTSKDGKFEIGKVPAGVPLTFQTWHEASTNSSGAVSADRPDLKWQPNGRFTVTLQPDETLDLKDIKVPATALSAK